MDPEKLIYNQFNANRATIEKWLAYPRQLQMEYGINPLLAGGAMRDTILGGEVKDLDVFISVSKARMQGVDFDSFVEDLADREGWQLKHCSNYEEMDPPPHTTLHSVWEFHSEFVDKPYNIVILPEDTSSQDTINRFDFGLNMIAVNTYSIITTNKWFLEDVKGQKCTVINERSREVRDRRYASLLQKYPALVLMSKEGLELDKPHQGLVLPPGV